jgi:hypothetical protein
MKQFTIYENKMDEKPDWSRLRNVDLADVSKTEFQGAAPFELPVPTVESVAAAPNFKGNWYPSVIDSTHIKLTGGTITCGSIFTPTVSSVTVDASALNYIYLRATLSASKIDGYVVGGSITATSIISSTSTLTSDNTYGYILLCTWQASALVAQYEFYSFFASLQNQGSGDTLFVYWNS